MYNYMASKEQPNFGTNLAVITNQLSSATLLILFAVTNMAVMSIVMIFMLVILLGLLAALGFGSLTVTGTEDNRKDDNFSSSEGESTIQKYTHQDVDFSIVKSLLDRSHGGINLQVLMSPEYPSLERNIAILAIQEQQLIKIANKFQVEYKLQEELNGQKMTPKMGSDILGKAYKELDTNSKYEMLPLFFSSDMTEEVSIYILEKPIRDLAFQAFEKLSENDGLSIRVMKEEYVSNQSLAYLLPLYEHIKLGVD